MVKKENIKQSQLFLAEKRGFSRVLSCHKYGKSRPIDLLEENGQKWKN